MIKTARYNLQRVMVVEDEGIVAADIEEALTRLGYQVAAVVGTGEEAIEQVPKEDLDLVLMDITLRGRMDGIEAALHIRKAHDIPVVFLTAHGDVGTLERAKISQPFGYVIKPFEERELRAAIEVGFYRHHVESKLRKMEQWLGSTLYSIGDGVITTDANGKVTFLNSIAEVLTGWRIGDAYGRPSSEVFRLIKHPGREALPDPFTSVVNQGITLHLANDTVLVAKDGTETFIDDSAAPIRDDDGEIMGVVLVFREITERLRAEAKIRDLQKELKERSDEKEAIERSRSKMETFTQSVSHDLYGPLRIINSFAGLLREDFGQQLDENGQKFLDIIQDNTRRMKQMIQDYLAFWDLGNKQPQPFTTVKMEELARLCAEEMVGETRGRSIQLSLQPMPDCKGDLPMLREVWMKLLSNALKYTAEEKEAVVELGGKRDGGRYVYYVKDNGPGIDPAKAGKLFGVFERFDSSGNFNGSGLGLAIVRQIMELHGGEAWAGTEEGNGATFYFSLPAND